MAYTDAEQAAALDIARARRLRWRWLPNGRCIAVRDLRGEEPTGVAGTEADDPVECMNLAEALIAAGERREAEQRARRLFDALARGTYFVRPGTVQVDGEPTLAWRVHLTSDNSVVAGPLSGLMAALIEVARLVNEPAPLPPGDGLSVVGSAARGR